MHSVIFILKGPWLPGDKHETGTCELVGPHAHAFIQAIHVAWKKVVHHCQGCPPLINSLGPQLFLRRRIITKNETYIKRLNGFMCLCQFGSKLDEPPLFVIPIPYLFCFVCLEYALFLGKKCPRRRKNGIVSK